MSKKTKKTPTPKTYVAFVIDKSGSMLSIREQVIRDYNEQVQQAKENAKDQEILACLVTFNGAVFEHTWLEDVNNMEEITTESYVPNGGTAMIDGIGYTIKKLQDTVEDKDEDHVAFLINIISDGEENASRHYDSATLRTMISACQETKRWTFAYMGCSESYLKEVAKSTNIPISNMAVWDSSNTVSASHGLASKNLRSRSYYSKRAMNVTDVDSYYSDNVACCADFTPSTSDANQLHVSSVHLANPYVPLNQTVTSTPGNVSSSQCILGQPSNTSPFDFKSISNLAAKSPDLTSREISHKVMRNDVLSKCAEVQWKS